MNIQTNVLLECGYRDGDKNKSIAIYRFEQTLPGRDLSYFAVSSIDPKEDLDKFLVYAKFFNTRSVSTAYLHAFMKYDSGQDFTEQDYHDMNVGKCYEELLADV
ncbi:hypothetical protein [Pseudomonas phage PA1C]|uniref:Uncharacterized protein n=1 Tax=Pseudomonas phage vB_PaeM_PS119XW TaxID=2601632 RepID=A0A5C1K9H4_9CAUD|nr:hypothetical protein PP933_gp195 [Pseudomonas phage vB_PaeM_PS119XW]QBX32350.1 hypothetical protein [Pseudomonas phage PA1C]QEM41924.1 hypothetical protein [Pseudomonas phage vB_PaeM_PS119XW]